MAEPEKNKNKTGRPPGSRNKNSWKVLEELRKNNFDIIEEVLEFYGYSKQIYVPLFEQMMKNRLSDLPLTEGMAQEDVDAMNAAGKSMGDVLGKLMSYCYPKLKALELDTRSGEQIKFSINIPVVEEGGKSTTTIDVPKSDYKLREANS